MERSSEERDDQRAAPEVVHLPAAQGQQAAFGDVARRHAAQELFVVDARGLSVAGVVQLVGRPEEQGDAQADRGRDHQGEQQPPTPARHGWLASTTVLMPPRTQKSP
ncbi:MAG: hypothetical protein ACK56I_11990, partial [bacterium]